MRPFDVSQVTEFYQTFRECTALEQIDLSNFHTDNAVTLRMLFYKCSSLTSLALSAFKTANVTNMYGMFASATSLVTLDLSNFDTSNVTDMAYVFYHCRSLKSVDVSSFNTSNVTTMAYMFRYCDSLEELDLSSFDLYHVTTTDHMFQWSTALTTLDLSSFYTPNAVHMEYMFNNCHGLKTLLVPNLSTSKVVDMSGMIADCWALQDLDLSSFDVRNVTSLNGFLYQAEKLEFIDLSSFYTPKLTNCANMFYKNNMLRVIDITGMELSQTTTTQGMFYQNGSLTTVYVSEIWDAGRVGSSSNMFTGCTSIVGGAGTTYIGSKTNREYARIDSAETPGYLTYRRGRYSTDPIPDPEPRMTNYACFGSTGETTSILTQVCDPSQIKAFRRFTGSADEVQTRISSGEALRIDDNAPLNPPIYAWLEEDGTLLYWTEAHHVYLTDSARFLWRGLDQCQSIDTTDINTTKLTDMSHMFEGDASLTSLSLTGFRTNNVTDMSYLFSGCTSLTALDISSFNGKVLTNMSHMFSDCRSLPAINIPFAVNAAEDMSYLYSGCSSAKTIVWKKSPVVTNLSHAFEGCSNLTVLDITTADTTHVTDMSYLFAGCKKLESINTRVFKTPNVTTMEGMFMDCQSMISFHVNGFDLSQTHSLSQMFKGCSSMTILDLTMLDPANVTDMSRMFDGCTAVKTIYANETWNTDSVTDSENMFRGCPVLTGGNGTPMDSNIVDKTRALIDTPSQIGYLTDKSTRRETVTYSSDSDNCEVEMADDDTWIFTFTGLDPTVPFFVWEDDYEGYDPSNTLDNYLSILNGEAVITNRKKNYTPPDEVFGSLTVSKTVTGEGLSADDRERTFLFTVTLTDTENQPLSGTKVFDGIAFADGKASFRLSDGETKTISQIPAGYHYTVTEEETTGFETASQNETGTIPENTAANVSFTNTKQVLQVETNSFTLKKRVDGNFERNDEAYSFMVSLTSLTPEQTYTLSDGTTFRADTRGRAVVTLTLADGEEVTFRELPVGAVYRINEAEGDYISAFEITNAAATGNIYRSAGMNTIKNQALSTSPETVDSGEQITVTFTNTKDVRQNVTIKKLVENSTSHSQTFTFLLELHGLTPNELISVTNIGRFRADDSGSLETEFFLAAGEETVLQGLPVGATYRVTETASDYISSFIIIDSNGQNQIVTPSAANERTNQALSTATETVNENEEVTLTFTNTKVQRDLTITKMVDMTYGLLTPAQVSLQSFDFSIRLTGLEPNAPYTAEYTASHATGVLSREYLVSSAQGEINYDFRLSHGRSCTIKNLPANATYQVSEKAAKYYAASYMITGSGGAQIISPENANDQTNQALSTAVETVQDQELSMNIVFTNVYSLSGYVLPAAGTHDLRWFIFLGFVGMLLFGGMIFLNTRHKRHPKT